MKRMDFRTGKVPDCQVQWNLTRQEKQKRIAVVGMSRGAGATFVAVSLAFLLSRSNFGEISRKDGQKSSLVPAAYVELRPPVRGEGLQYYGAGLDQRFRSHRSQGFTGGYGTEVHLHKGVNWQVFSRVPESAENPGRGSEPASTVPEDEKGNPYTAGDWIVADSPPLEQLELEDWYDLIVAVISPMPAAVYGGAETYDFLRNLEHRGRCVLWIVNQDNSAVNHGELGRFLKLGDWFSIPLIAGEVFFRAQYSCRLPVELLEGGSLAMESLEAVRDEILRRVSRKES